MRSPLLTERFTSYAQTKKILDDLGIHYFSDDIESFATKFTYKFPQELTTLFFRQSSSRKAYFDPPTVFEYGGLQHRPYNMVYRLLQAYAIEHALSGLSEENQKILIQKLNSPEYLKELDEYPFEDWLEIIFDEITLLTDSRQLSLYAHKTNQKFGTDSQGQSSFLKAFFQMSRQRAPNPTQLAFLQEYRSQLNVFFHPDLANLLNWFIRLYNHPKSFSADTPSILSKVEERARLIKLWWNSEAESVYETQTECSTTDWFKWFSCYEKLDYWGIGYEPFEIPPSSRSTVSDTRVQVSARSLLSSQVLKSDSQKVLPDNAEFNFPSADSGQASQASVMGVPSTVAVVTPYIDRQSFSDKTQLTLKQAYFDLLTRSVMPLGPIKDIKQALASFSLPTDSPLTKETFEHRWKLFQSEVEQAEKEFFYDNGIPFKREENLRRHAQRVSDFRVKLLAADYIRSHYSFAEKPSPVRGSGELTQRQFKEHLEVLEIPIGEWEALSEDTLKAYYKKAARKFHPDKHLDEKEKYDELFQKVGQAKDALLELIQNGTYDWTSFSQASAAEMPGVEKDSVEVNAEEEVPSVNPWTIGEENFQESYKAVEKGARSYLSSRWFSQFLLRFSFFRRILIFLSPLRVEKIEAVQSFLEKLPIIQTLSDLLEKGRELRHLIREKVEAYKGTSIRREAVKAAEEQYRKQNCFVPFPGAWRFDTFMGHNFSQDSCLISDSSEKIKERMLQEDGDFHHKIGRHFPDFSS